MKALLFFRSVPFFRQISYFLMRLIGVDIPLSVSIGENFDLPHWGYGVVVHPFVKIGSNVKIYQGVTIGRADIYYEMPKSDFNSIEIGNNVILCAGAKLLASDNCKIEDGVVLGANSVLIVKGPLVKSGVYVGIPAKKI